MRCHKDKESYQPQRRIEHIKHLVKQVEAPEDKEIQKHLVLCMLISFNLTLKKQVYQIYIQSLMQHF